MSSPAKTRQVAIATYLEEAGLDISYGFTVIDFLADHGMVQPNHTFGTPRGTITPAGILAIQQLHADRLDPKIRAAALRQEMITWLDDQEEQGVRPASFQDFTDSLEPSPSGDSYSERELRGAAEYLHRHQLTDSVHVEELPDGWIAPRLTVEGRECITDHGGDIGEYVRDRRGAGSTTHNKTTVHISDNNGNLVIDGDRFTQNYNAGAAGELRAAEVDGAAGERRADEVEVPPENFASPKSTVVLAENSAPLKSTVVPAQNSAPLNPDGATGEDRIAEVATVEDSSGEVEIMPLPRAQSRGLQVCGDESDDSEADLPFAGFAFTVRRVVGQP